MARAKKGSPFDFRLWRRMLNLKSLSAMLVVAQVVVKIDLFLLIAFLADKHDPFFSFLAWFHLDQAFLASWMAALQQDWQVWFSK